uniref:Uncharacterized protein n=1 Tax=Physcomitrium patens TaxID=3218 RepID=A0A2K1JM29_PHYPA|nr:hypothetical protein PHYPA_017428 [Physcomitrium patens]
MGGASNCPATFSTQATSRPRPWCSSRNVCLATMDFLFYLSPGPFEGWGRRTLAMMLSCLVVCPSCGPRDATWLILAPAHRGVAAAHTARHGGYVHRPLQVLATVTQSCTFVTSTFFAVSLE